MTSSLGQPHYCNPKAFEMFGHEVQNLDQPDALLRAAVAIAKHEMPEVETEDVVLSLDAIANEIRSRVQHHSPRALLSHAHNVLFDEMCFVGNVEDYYSPRNSYLPAVLEDKRGIPITLTLIYKEVLDRLGIVVSGINAPGHFLAQLTVDNDTMLVDTFFQGRVLSEAEAYQRIQDVVGETDYCPSLLRIATNQVWLARMLQNLQVIFSQQRARAQLAAMLELQALLDQHA